MIPFEIRMIPLYLLMRQLHLSDTYAALILPFISGGFGTFLMRQYISAIPDELIDAARIDGASELTIYTTIILPLCGPALAALTVLSALWRWNDVLWPLLVISDRQSVYHHVWPSHCRSLAGNIYGRGAGHLRDCDPAAHDPLSVPPALYH